MRAGACAVRPAVRRSRSPTAAGRSPFSFHLDAPATGSSDCERKAGRAAPRVTCSTSVHLSPRSLVCLSRPSCWPRCGSTAPHRVAAARDRLGGLELVALDDPLLDAAAELAPPLRSLDAIHLAAALSLGADLGVVVTYDVRMADAARALGLDVAAP